jgi:hypothetical protein
VPLKSKKAKNGTKQKVRNVSPALHNFVTKNFIANIAKQHHDKQETFYIDHQE